MDQLDRLIEEIASVLGIEREEVFNKFTQEDLNNLLEKSTCVSPDSNIPLFTGSADDDSIPCEDLGAPLNPDETTDLDSLLDDLSNKNKTPDLDVTKCVDSVNELNEEIEKELDTLTKYRILLDKLIELNDNLIGIQYYYDERIKRVGVVLKDFEPVLKTIKNLEQSKKDNLNKILKLKSQNSIGDSVVVETGKLLAKNELIDVEIAKNNLILKNKSAKYPSLLTKGIEGAFSSVSVLSDMTSKVISDIEIVKINRELKKYSEFVKIKKYSSTGSTFSKILSRPLIEFNLEFQNLNLIEITKQVVDKQTGKKKEVTEKVPIKDNSLLNSNSFFNNIPGYSIKDVKPKDNPKGALYKDYYNKLNDPINNFFSLDERGLTKSASLVDPNLKGTDATTKKEKDKEYYISDLKRLEEFYENFESIFKERRQYVKDKVISENIDSLKSTMATIARVDVDAMLALGGVNLYLPNDNSRLKSIIKNIKNDNTELTRVIKELNSEITRIEEEIEKLTPTSSDIKTRLKEMNPECFSNISDDDEDTDKDECKSVKSLLGSDPFFESISKGSNAALPNCTQLCYWREFAKVVNKMGLFPIPNDPRTLRYWPVGLVIYVPAEIKIPLPIIWLPILTITSPVGTHVLFITINGLFITPVMFFYSSSGLKKHVATIKGSTDKFGFDRFDESIKDTIKIPLNIAGLTDPDLKITSEVIDKSEGVSDAIEESVKSISKRMDDLGNPVIKKVNAIKSKIEERRSELSKQYAKSLEDGNIEESDRLRRELLTDGINVDEKIDALSEDIINYFDRIDLPVITLPKEKGKVNPNISGNKLTETKAKEAVSNKLNDAIPDSKTSVLDNITTSIAKYKEEIEDVFKGASININDRVDDLKNAMADMVDVIFKKSIGEGVDKVDVDQAVKELSSVKESGDPKKINETIKKLSDKLDSNLVKQTLSITPDIISALSDISIEFDPFASCCSIKKSFSLPVAANPIVLSAFNSAKPLVIDKIKSYSINDLKLLFGGKPEVNARDVRLGLLSIVRSVIPKSISFPKPDLNIGSVSSAFGGLLGSIEIPQAEFPDQVKALTMPKQVEINLNIIKQPLKSLLQSVIRNTLPVAFPQDIEQYFYSISPNDIKRFLKDFIRDNINEMEKTLAPLYALTDITKSSKGVDLSIVEKSLFKVPPYGPLLNDVFTAKTLVKMNLPNSSSYFSINLQALELAIQLVKPAIKPIVSTPIVYPIIAGAAVAGGIDGIRKLHPILNQDDIPSWERLTAKNILLLAFIDEFIINAADNLGFYRSYL